MKRSSKAKGFDRRRYKKANEAHLRHRIVRPIWLDWALDIARVSGSETSVAPHLRLDCIIIKLIADILTRPHWVDASAERLHPKPEEGGNKVNSTCLAPKAFQKATKKRQQGLSRLPVLLR